MKKLLLASLLLITNALAHVLGALVLSRACPDDSPLADEILEVCRTQILDQQKAG